MTVSTTTYRADYTGNGSTTVFTVPFYFIDPTHIVVYRTQISTGVVTTLALTTNYTVSGTGVSSGGSITTLVAPTSDQKISILRNIPLVQDTLYTTNDPFPAKSHETALDKLCMQVQQVNEITNRSFTLNPATSGINTTFPAPIANYALGWDATATSLTNIASAAQISAASTNATAAAASATAASISATNASTSAANAAASAATVAASSALLATLSGRNRLINGNFDIWQSYTGAVTATTSFQYLADQFRFKVGSGTATFNRNTHTVANAAYGTYYATFGVASNGVSELSQPIENVRTLAGQTVTISFYARIGLGSAQTVTVFATQYFGTGGSPSTSVTTSGTTSVAFDNVGFSRYTVTLTLPSLSGKTIGTNNDHYLSIGVTLPNGTYNFDICGWQVEASGVATPFEFRPIAQELALCQRYLGLLGPAAVLVYVGSIGSFAGAVCPIVFPAAMRTSPTVTANITSSGSGWLGILGSNTTSTTGTVIAAGTQQTTAGAYAIFNLQADARF